jgi:hypothetical protein
MEPAAALLVASKNGIEVWIISDIHPEQTIMEMLELNEIPFSKQRVRSADYKAHGEMCKAVLCEQLGIDILIDDFPGYVAAGKHVGLLVSQIRESPTTTIRGRRTEVKEILEGDGAPATHSETRW